MTLLYCPLYSGSSGNSSIIKTPEAKILVDAGLSGKAICEALDSIDETPCGFDGILITHEHTDHCKGAGVLSRKYDIPIYANASTWNAMKKHVGEVKLSNQVIFDSNSDFYIKDLNILPYSISHDAADPVAFCFYYKNKKISQMTDTGRVSKNVFDIISGSDLVLLESNHDLNMLKDGSYPEYLKNRIRSSKGHLSNNEAAKVCCALAKTGTKHIVLGHLSGENNDEQLAFDHSYKSLVLDGCDVGEDKDVELYVAHRSKVSMIFRFS